jgi:hypothetical protein
MVRNILVPIESGDKTCAFEPGHFCKWLRTKRFGTIAFCQLFSEQPDSTGSIKVEPLEEENGWLQRHVDCLALEVKGESNVS